MDKKFLKKIKFFPASDGTSMLPIIYPKDRLFIKATSVNRLKVNDVITFYKKNKFITHRIIYKKNQYIITKGDSNPKIDGRIYPKQIIGKVYQLERNGRVMNLENLFLVQSTIYFQEIVKIKRILEKLKIDYVFLKGLPLHLYYEKFYPQRIYWDIDILINPKNISEVNNILKRIGYLRLDNYLSKTHEAMKKETADVYYYKIVGNYKVLFDIHFEVDLLSPHVSNAVALYPQKDINKITRELLKTKRLIVTHKESFWILDDKFLIIYLALHLFRHNFRGSYRYQFMDKIIRSQQFRAGRNNNNKEWEEISQKIKEYRLENFVFPAFKLLEKYYDSPIPRSFFISLKPLHLYTLIFFHKTNIFDSEPRIIAGINRFKNLFFLSPQPLWEKVLVFLNPQVVYSVFWIMWKKLFSFFSNLKLVL